MVRTDVIDQEDSVANAVEEHDVPSGGIDALHETQTDETTRPGGEPASKAVATVPVDGALAAPNESTRSLPSPPSSGKPGDENVPPYILTNRYNLLDILSSELIKPLVGFSKYYTDLFRVAPGRMPLLTTAAGPDLVGFVAQDEETAFPVALELDPAILDLSDVPVGPAGRDVVWAPDGAIPMGAVSRIWFRSESELAEVRARRFRNLEVPVDRLGVAADLFGPSHMDAETTIEWLESLQPPARSSRSRFSIGLPVLGARDCRGCSSRRELPGSRGRALAGMRKEPKPRDNEPVWIAGGRLRTLMRDRRRSPALNDRLFEASVESLLRVDPAGELEAG